MPTLVRVVHQAGEVGEALIVAIGATTAAVLIPVIVRWRHRRPSLAGSIARVVAWSGDGGDAVVLSGAAKGTVVSVTCGDPTSVGEHVVLVATMPTAAPRWTAVHLDDADDTLSH